MKLNSKKFRTILLAFTLIFSSVAFSTTPAVAEPQPVCVDSGTVDESGQPNLNCTLVDSNDSNLPICSDGLKVGAKCKYNGGSFIDCTPNGGALPWECTALEDQDTPRHQLLRQLQHLLQSPTKL